MLWKGLVVFDDGNEVNVIVMVNHALFYFNNPELKTNILAIIDNSSSNNDQKQDNEKESNPILCTQSDGPIYLHFTNNVIKKTVI